MRFHHICEWVEVPAVTEEFASESSQDDDSVCILLASSITLAWWDRNLLCFCGISTIDHFPRHVKVVQGRLDIKSLDIVEVLLVLILDATKYVYKLAIEFTT